jgi:hypothetical protein
VLALVRRRATENNVNDVHLSDGPQLRAKQIMLNVGEELEVLAFEIILALWRYVCSIMR